MRDKLEALKASAMELISSAADERALEDLRVRFLGRKGELTAVLKDMGRLSAEERPVIGQIANDARESISGAVKEAERRLAAAAVEHRLKAEKIDVTLPGKTVTAGHRHPMTVVLDEVVEMFIGMGFSVAEGPEVETTYYCFDALNTGEHHPARDRQDTFYLSDDVILRTQTSSVQIRTMERQKPPIRIISPGRTYRKDEIDATHSPVFHQIEGLVVDKGVTFADLKGTLEALIKGIYGENAAVRFRPHHFPYTEPSAEVDLQCFKCGGSGCPLCKGQGWIELLGSGMVHPKVLAICGIDPEVYTGFAFGVGIERLCLGRFSIPDMRLLFENDMRFLRQFG
ncbi:MAG: phenylalanine--tRNA ligase subunit alpha [Oscillospiraceae bacterium]|nr:phenylalanine--tRNA ligase subunit alpha [Oscillospiraceae bacterium]